MKIQNSIKRHVLLAAAVSMMLASGCATLKSRMPTLSSLPTVPSLKQAFTKDADEVDAVDAVDDAEPTDEFGAAEKMLVVWKDCVIDQPGKPQMRGFGGRVFFYNASEQVIKAEGELVIYGFDDSVKDRQGSEADQRFIFRKENLQSHYGKSGLGHSYSFQIPWDEVGGVEKSVTLIPFFKTADERIVRAGQSIYTLKGKRSEELIFEELTKSSKLTGLDDLEVAQADFVAGEGDEKGNLSTVGFESKVAGASIAESKTIRTTTISVPRGMSQRLKNTVAPAMPTGSNSTIHQAAASYDSSTKPVKKPRSRTMSPQESAAKSQIDSMRSAAAAQLGGGPATMTSAERKEARVRRAVFGKPGAFQ